MKSVLLGVIRIYQLTFSAIFGRSCRYLPTCSDYARDAVEKHGAWHGLLLAVARVSRCHPWGGEGYDPVPEVYEGPEWRQKRRGP